MENIARDDTAKVQNKVSGLINVSVVFMSLEICMFIISIFVFHAKIVKTPQIMGRIQKQTPQISVKLYML